ncbi:MAG: hypothetical protein KIG95_14505, partial [Comamonas sp.]|nr:hypothetical protein [Comamonas sp.]
FQASLDAVMLLAAQEQAQLMKPPDATLWPLSCGDLIACPEQATHLNVRFERGETTGLQRLQSMCYAT